MNRIDLLKKTLDILVRAQTTGNLEHGDACGCAVGNLVAYQVKKQHFYEDGMWTDVVGNMREGCRIKNIEKEYPVGISQIKRTGYTPREIERIERAFENYYRDGTEKTDTDGNIEEDSTGVKGLLRVVSVLGDIHEAPRKTITCIRKQIKKGEYIYNNKSISKFSWSLPVFA